MSDTPWRVGLASLHPSESVPAGVAKIADMLRRCGRDGVRIVCFSELYLPGPRGTIEVLPPPDQALQAEALAELRERCREHAVAAVVGMEWVSELGLENRAFVISGQGEVLGHQTKNQLYPGGEEENYVPDGKRRVFELDGVTFGIVICHEGWCYPETVRWAVRRGAQVVFQPQFTRNRQGGSLERWGESFFEKAMECRARENTVYFASVNCAIHNQNSATSLIDPSGKLVGYVPYGREDLLVADLDLSLATRLWALGSSPICIRIDTGRMTDTD